MDMCTQKEATHTLSKIPFRKVLEKRVGRGEGYWKEVVTTPLSENIGFRAGVYTLF